MLRMFFFFFRDTATTEIYTLSLHDALPISGAMRHMSWPTPMPSGMRCSGLERRKASDCRRRTRSNARSEEHTSELQSQSNLVCRLLLEKKKEFLLASLAQRLTHPSGPVHAP